MRGRLNLFQAAMLRWRELYPYNAVHVAELSGPLDVAQLTDAIASHLTALGVTGLALDTARRRFSYAGGPVRVVVNVLAGNGDPVAILEQEMERQLNLPFTHDGPLDPFRFFALDAGASFHLGVAYDHVIAGGDSIVALLKGIAVRYAGGAMPALPPPDLYPATYFRLFRRNLVRAHVGQYSLPGMLLRSRRAFRPFYRHGDSWHNAVTSLELSPDLYAAVLRAAKAWDVTLNDLLLAMLLTALAPELPERLQAKRRNEIAVASVINIRRELAPGPEAAFGQFLSSFMVSHPVPDGITLEALARDIHTQTKRIKQRKLYLMTLYMIAAGGLVWPYLTPAQRTQMHAKNYPVWAGMTMLNVEAIWGDAPGDAQVLHYLRAVSTGPFTPILMMPASVGDCLHIGVTYRTAAFDKESVGRISAKLIECARNLL